MKYTAPRVIPAGESAILIDWADEIDDDVNLLVHAVTHAISERHLPSITDLVPAYSSLLVCFDHELTTTSEIADLIQPMLAPTYKYSMTTSRLVEIPTVYGGEFGPDLGYVAAQCGMPPCQVADLHASVEYRVYFIGFAPGFPYLGPVPEQIRVPRLETPRTRVDAGSIGIAGGQTGIYPMELPGGWRIIGRTKSRLFDPSADPPSLLRPGDRVRFVPIR